MIKFSVKTLWHFDIMLFIWSIYFFLLHITIMNDSLLKLLKVLLEKMHKTTLCVLRLWWQINNLHSSNMALLVLRNYWRVFLKITEDFYQGWCNHTQHTPSVTPLDHDRNYSTSCVATTYAINKIFTTRAFV